MASRNHYDAICVGGGFSSYLCAALLAKNGQKVMLVEDSDRLGDHGFNVSESVGLVQNDALLLNGVRSGGALGGILRELGFDLDSDFQSTNTVAQLLSPDYRIVISGDIDSTSHELGRELKAIAPDVIAFFKRLYRANSDVPEFINNAFLESQANAKQTAQWRKFWGADHARIAQTHPVSIYEILSELKSRSHIEHLCAALFGTCSYAAPENLGVELTLRALPVLLRESSFYVGGTSGFKHKLNGIIEKAGGVVRSNSIVQSLIADGREIKGVLLSSFEGVINSKNIVLGARHRRLYSSLPAVARNQSIERALSKIVPHSWRYTVSVRVRKELIPIGATALMSYVRSHLLPLEEENFLRIQTQTDGEFSNVLLTAFVPYRASSIDYEYLRNLGGKMLHTLGEIMPFLKDYLVEVVPEFRKDSAQIKQYYRFSEVDWVPDGLMQYYVRGFRDVQDFWGAPCATAHPNLHFVGRAVWPSLGAYGEALAAQKVFQAVTNQNLGLRVEPTRPMENLI